MKVRTTNLDIGQLADTRIFSLPLECGDLSEINLNIRKTAKQEVTGSLLVMREFKSCQGKQTILA